MLAIALSLVLILTAPAFALSTDAAAVVSARLAGQQAAPAIEEELTGYLDQDDIAGAQAYVADLAERGEINDGLRRTLEDRIWRTKTERTLEYAKKIREAIRDSDLDAMRDYNARMQRLSGTGPVRAGPVEEPAESMAPDAGEVEAAEAEVAAIDPEALDADAEPSSPEAEAASFDTELIVDLVRRGEAAIGAYNLSIARPGKDSGLGMVDQLMTLGDEGEAAAKGLGRKVMAVYKALIERDIDRGRLDKAATFAERMAEVAARAGLPLDEVNVLKAQIVQSSAGREEHDRLIRQATALRDRGRLVAPDGEHALASAAEAFRLGVEPDAAAALLDDIIDRQRSRADQLVNDGRFRDGAVALNGLGDALLAANVGETTLVAALRAKASALYRRADLRDRVRERKPVDETPAETEAEADENGSPFTFINPF